MSGSVSFILMPIRYFMIAGFGVLGLLFYDQLDLIVPGKGLDFEQILPSAISQFVPVGFLGLLLAGLLAAFHVYLRRYAKCSPGLYSERCILKVYQP